MRKISPRTSEKIVLYVQSGEYNMRNRQGGCLCGAVRYVLKGEPQAIAMCHCTHCQKQSGSAFSVNLFIKEADYEQQGKTRFFLDRGDSGQPSQRHFCPECGSPIMTKAAITPGVVLVKAGTLDTAEGLRPQIEIYTDRAMKWVDRVPGAASFGESPPPG